MELEWQVENHGLQFVVCRTGNGNPMCQAITEKRSIAMTSLLLMLEEMSKGPEEVKENAGLIFNFSMLQIPTNTYTFLMLAFKMLKFSANMHTFLIHISLQQCNVCFGKRKNKA